MFAGLIRMQDDRDHKNAGRLESSEADTKVGWLVWNGYRSLICWYETPQILHITPLFDMVYWIYLYIGHMIVDIYFTNVPSRLHIRTKFCKLTNPNPGLGSSLHHPWYILLYTSKIYWKASIFCEFWTA